MTVHFDTRDPLLARVLWRTRSLFADDVATNAARLASAIAGRHGVPRDDTYPEPAQPPAVPPSAIPPTPRN